MGSAHGSVSSSPLGRGPSIGVDLAVSVMTNRHLGVAFVTRVRMLRTGQGREVPGNGVADRSRTGYRTDRGRLGHAVIDVNGDVIRSVRTHPVDDSRHGRVSGRKGAQLTRGSSGSSPDIRRSPSECLMQSLCVTNSPVETG